MMQKVISALLLFGMLSCVNDLAEVDKLFQTD